MVFIVEAFNPYILFIIYKTTLPCYGFQYQKTSRKCFASSLVSSNAVHMEEFYNSIVVNLVIFIRARVASLGLFW